MPLKLIILWLVETIPENKIEDNAKTKKVKDILFGVGGIALGLLFVAIVIAVLSYFNVINIIPNSDKIVLKTTIQNLRKPARGLKLTRLKAERAGYRVAFEMISIGNETDVSGRHILASKERVINGWIDKFGWQNNNASGGARLIGVFKEWKEIKGSKDHYAVFETYPGFSEYSVRINFEGQSIGSKDVGSSTTKYYKTVLEVDDLNYGPLNSGIKPIEVVGNLGAFQEVEIDKIIKINDVIAIDGIVNLTAAKNDKDMRLVMDENNVPIAKNLQIRRFGGIETVREELKK